MKEKFKYFLLVLASIIGIIFLVGRPNVKTNRESEKDLSDSIIKDKVDDIKATTVKIDQAEDELNSIKSTAEHKLDSIDSIPNDKLVGDFNDWTKK